MIEFPPINRGIATLNKFLGLKTAESPVALSQLVQPVAELRPWYLWSNVQVVRTTQTIGAGQIGPLAPAALNVPAGAQWLLFEFSIRVTSVAGLVLQYCGMYFEPAESRVNAVGPIVDNYSHPSDSLLECITNRDAPLLLPPNAQLGVMSVLNTGTGQTATLVARFVQFEA